jgi:hypothetical protein
VFLLFPVFHARVYYVIAKLKCPFLPPPHPSFYLFPNSVLFVLPFHRAVVPLLLVPNIVLASFLPSFRSRFRLLMNDAVYSPLYFLRRQTSSSIRFVFCLLVCSQSPSDNRMEPPYGRQNNEYDPSAQAVPSQAGINPILPISPNQRTGTPTMPMEARATQQPTQYSNSNGQQQAIGVGNRDAEFEEPRRNKFLDILCCRMH